MNSIELYTKEGKATGVWFCANEGCKLVYRTKDQADQCCGPRKCECGNEITRYYTKCGDCRIRYEATRELERFNTAEKVARADYDGFVYYEGTGNDGYHQCLEDFIDECESEGIALPHYVWSCTPIQFVHIAFDDVSSHIADHAYEDFDANQLNGMDELKAAFEAFNKANESNLSYEINFKKAVLIQ